MATQIKTQKKVNEKTQAKISAKLFDFASGKEVSTVDLPASVFGQDDNQALLHQAVVALDNNNRQVLAHVKTKAEVSGGGKKPWKQKGTGRARTGSTRNPQWIGGGKAHGPRNNRNFTQKINRKMLAQATRVALSDRARSSAVVMARDLKLNEIKTATAIKLLKQLPLIGKTTLILLSDNNAAIVKSFRNIPRTLVKRALDVNVRDVLGHDCVILAEEALPILVTRLGK